MRRRAKTAIAARTIVPTGVLPKIKIVKRDVAREERRDQDDVSAREMGVAFAERDNRRGRQAEHHDMAKVAVDHERDRREKKRGAATDAAHR